MTLLTAGGAHNNRCTTGSPNALHQQHLTPAQQATQAAITAPATHQDGKLPVRTGLAWAALGEPSVLVPFLSDAFHGIVVSLCSDCVHSQRSCPYIKFSSLGVPLQSECSYWFPVSLSKNNDCCCNKCLDVKTLLYMHVASSQVTSASELLHQRIPLVQSSEQLLVYSSFRPSGCSTVCGRPGTSRLTVCLSCIMRPPETLQCSSK